MYIIQCKYKQTIKGRATYTFLPLPSSATASTICSPWNECPVDRFEEGRSMTGVPFRAGIPSVVWRWICGIDCIGCGDSFAEGVCEGVEWREDKRGCMIWMCELDVLGECCEECAEGWREIDWVGWRGMGLIDWDDWIGTELD